MPERYNPEQMAEFMKQDASRDATLAAKATETGETGEAGWQKKEVEFVFDEESGGLVNPEQQVADAEKIKTTREQIDALLAGEGLPSGPSSPDQSIRRAG